MNIALKAAADDDEVKCECCNARLAFQWSDTHGVGVCISCGLPYRIIHYEDRDGKQIYVERPPMVAVTDTGLSIAKRYWSETARRVFPAAFDMGFVGRRDRTYSGASKKDCELFQEWLVAHEAEFSAVSP